MSDVTTPGLAPYGGVSGFNTGASTADARLPSDDPLSAGFVSLSSIPRSNVTFPNDVATRGDTDVAAVVERMVAHLAIPGEP